MAAVRRLEDGEQMPVLPGRKSKRRFRVGNEVERAELVNKLLDEYENN